MQVEIHGQVNEQSHDRHTRCDAHMAQGKTFSEKHAQAQTLEAGHLQGDGGFQILEEPCSRERVQEMGAARFAECLEVGVRDEPFDCVGYRNWLPWLHQVSADAVLNDGRDGAPIGGHNRHAERDRLGD